MLVNRGASLLEMLFAMAIAAFAMPFAYRQISGVSENLSTLAAAKKIVLDSEHVRNYIRRNSTEFPMNEFILAETEDKENDVYISKDESGTIAFVVAKAKDRDFLTQAKTAGFIGADAAVVEADGAAYSAAGGWSIFIEGTNLGDIVYRIMMAKGENDTEKYLHRTILSEGELSTMKRDLSMGNFSIMNAAHIDAEKLNSTDLSTYLVRAPVIAANSLYFTNGLNLNPAASRIPGMRATGDVIGFRNIWTDTFTSPAGQLTTDRATIATSIVVSNKFEVKAPYSRTVSGFAGVSAGIARTSYLDTNNLTFLPGFGLTVSGELLYSSTPPIRLGSWTFPNGNGAGPKFGTLRLKNFSDRNISFQTPDFSKIIKENWQ